MKIDAEKLGRVDAAVSGLAKRMDAFEEGNHPREANGQFGTGGGAARTEITLPKAAEGADPEAHLNTVAQRLGSPAYGHHEDEANRHHREANFHREQGEFHASRGDDPRHAEAANRHADAAEAHLAAHQAHAAGANQVLRGEKSELGKAQELSRKARATGRVAFAASRGSEGKRTDGDFQKLEGKLAHEKGVTDPAALAATIGREKYGAKGMAAKAAAGRREAAK